MTPAQTLQSSKTHTIFLSFETREAPPGIDVFLPSRRKNFTSLQKDVTAAIGSSTGTHPSSPIKPPSNNASNAADPRHASCAPPPSDSASTGAARAGAPRGVTAGRIPRRRSYSSSFVSPSLLEPVCALAPTPPQIPMHYSPHTNVSAARARHTRRRAALATRARARACRRT